MIDRSLNYGRHIIDHFLKDNKCENILDVGAGDGNDLEIARKNIPNVKLYAIECYPESIEKLKSKDIAVYPLNIEIDKLPFENESLDIIKGNQIFEHTKEVFWIFHEITRVLKVGGKLLIGVPNLASLHNRILLGAGLQPTSIKTHSAHVRGFTKSDILKFFKNCFPQGYQLKRFRGSNFYPFPAWLAKPLARIFPGMAWSIFLLLKKVEPYDNNSFLKYPVEEQLQTNFYIGKKI